MPSGVSLRKPAAADCAPLLTQSTKLHADVTRTVIEPRVSPRCSSHFANRRNVGLLVGAALQIAAAAYLRSDSGVQARRCLRLLIVTSLWEATVTPDYAQLPGSRTAQPSEFASLTRSAPHITRRSPS